jgi:hypothetical protein
MDEKPDRCPGPFLTPMPRWLLWVIIALGIGIVTAVGLIPPGAIYGLYRSLIAWLKNLAGLSF